MGYFFEPTSTRPVNNISELKLYNKGISQQTQNIDQMLEQCWANVLDGGPPSVQHLVDVSCLLGYDSIT